MLTFILCMLAFIVIGIMAILFVGTGGIAILLVFGDVIIGAFLIYKIIKAICKK